MSIKLYPPQKRALLEKIEYLFQNRASASKVINYTFKNNKKWGAKDRRAFAQTYYGVLRDWGLCLAASGQTDWCVEEASAEQIAGACEAYLEEDFSENKKKLLKHPELEFIFKYSLSPELLKVLKRNMESEKLKSYLEASQKEAPLFIRANRFKISLSDLQSLLAEEGLDSKKIGEEGLKILEKKNVFQLEAFKKGYFEVQDGASQRVAPFLELEPGMRVLDTCAGAGGKSLHIADRLKNKGKLISMDIHEHKLKELKKRVKRSGLQNVETRVIKGAKTYKHFKEASFDRILLDVPCSGSGTYRRKPESKLFFKEASYKELLEIQKQILQQNAPLLKKGGLLVYATCSVLEEENAKPVKEFLKENPNFEWLGEEPHFVGEEDFDGFYMAKIKRIG